MIVISVNIWIAQVLRLKMFLFTVEEFIECIDSLSSLSTWRPYRFCRSIQRMGQMSPTVGRWFCVRKDKVACKRQGFLCWLLYKLSAHVPLLSELNVLSNVHPRFCQLLHRMLCAVPRPQRVHLNINKKLHTNPCIFDKRTMQNSIEICGSMSWCFLG